MTPRFLSSMSATSVPMRGKTTLSISLVEGNLKHQNICLENDVHRDEIATWCSGSNNTLTFVSHI